MFILAVAMVFAAQGVADEELFETLLDIETDVASARKTSVRDSPGIVTIITRDEIERSGARPISHRISPRISRTGMRGHALGCASPCRSVVPACALVHWSSWRSPHVRRSHRL
jgi:outer membrane receptor for ferrienterochelin and colicin